ncbi:MATE family efflux transporter [bacterium]|nr:MATE family efflux transporter [bacterium]
MKKDARDLTEGSIVRNLWYLALPMIAGNLLQDFFNIVDMIFVGRIGPDAIAAVGMGGILLYMTFTIAIGISTGTVAMVSRFIGEQKHDAAEHVTMQSLLLGILCSVGLAVVGYPLAEPILRLLGAKGNVIPLGISYFRIMLLGAFTMFLSYTLSSALRGAGDAKTPVIIFAFSTVLNIILDPLLIFGVWIFPRLGVAGSALATVIARGAGLAVFLWGFFTKRFVLWLKLSDAQINLDIMKRIIKIGAFGSLQALLRNLSGLILMRIVTFYDKKMHLAEASTTTAEMPAVASYTLGMRLRMIVMMPGFGVANAVAPLVGQNLGAGKPKRAEKSAWLGVAFGAGIMMFAGVIYIVFANFIMSAFTQDPEVIRIGVVYVRIQAITYGFIGLSIVLGRGFSGAGDTLPPMVFTGISLLGFAIPAVIVMANWLGLIGIWIGIAASNVVQATMMAFWFLRGKWKEKEV